jgi:hypothetical protein
VYGQGERHGALHIVLAFAQDAASARAKRDTSNVEWPIHSNKASSSNMTRKGVPPRVVPICFRTRSRRGRRVVPLGGDSSGK